MESKVLLVLWLIICAKSIDFCDRRCICEQNLVRLVCKGVDEHENFKYGELTRDIEFRDSFLGLKWVTEQFGHLESVEFWDSEILDCDGLYEVRVIGGCGDISQVTSEPSSESILTKIDSEVTSEYSGKSSSTQSVEKWVSKKSFDITISLVVIVSVLICVVVILVMKKVLSVRFARIREARMDAMVREMGFEEVQGEVQGAFGDEEENIIFEQKPGN